MDLDDNTFVVKGKSSKGAGLDKSKLRTAEARVDDPTRRKHKKILGLDEQLDLATRVQDKESKSSGRKVRKYRQAGEKKEKEVSKWKMYLIFGGVISIFLVAYVAYAYFKLKGME